MIYLKYNTIKPFYVKSAMTGKKGEKEDLSETFDFN